MYPKAIILVLLAALLFFGCTYPSGGEAAPTQSGGASPGPSVPTPTPGGQPSVNQTANQSTQPSGVQIQPGGDLAGKTFEELAALGVPIKCEITTSSGTATLYKGTGSDMRTEMSVSGGPCPKIVSIIKG